MNDYRFDKKRHRHELLVDGKWVSLTGCTTVLSVLAKPALIQWSANMAVDFLEAAIKSGLELTPELLKDAKTAHRKKKEKAGDWGTEVHELVEIYCKTGNFTPVGDDPLSLMNKAVLQFITWAQFNKVKFLESEKNVFSRKMFTGGIVDIVCEIDGQRWIADVKTGSGIYPEHFAQMSGYDLMLEEMGELKADGYIVLNLRKDGGFEEKKSIINEDNKKFFLACLEIYRQQEKIKNQIL